MKISQYPAVATPALTDILPIVQNGVTLKATMQQVSDLIAPAAAASLNVPATVNASIATHNADAAAHGSVLANFTAHAGVGGVAKHPVATALAAGFMPALSGNASDTLRGDGAWGGAATSDFLSDLVNSENDITDTYDLGIYSPTPFGRLFRLSDNGTITDYAVKLPNPATGVRKMIGFEVRRQGLATKQFSITPYSTERIGGKAGGAVFKLIAGNKLWLMSDGTDWIIISQQLDTEWSTPVALAPTFLGAVTTAPTVGTTTTNKIKWRRVGGHIEIAFNIVSTGAGGPAAGSGIYLVTTPIGTFDTGAVLLTGTAGDAVGHGWFTTGGSTSASAIGTAIIYDSTRLCFRYTSSTSDGFWDSANYPFNAGARNVSFIASIPVVGW